MCRGQIAEDALVEVPPDYEAGTEQNDEDRDPDEPFCCSSKVSYN